MDFARCLDRKCVAEQGSKVRSVEGVFISFGRKAERVSAKMQEGEERNIRRGTCYLSWMAYIGIPFNGLATCLPAFRLRASAAVRDNRRSCRQDVCASVSSESKRREAGCGEG